MCMLTTIPPASATKHETYLAQTVRRYLKLQIIFRSLGSKKFKGLGLIVTTQSAIIVLPAKYSNIGILPRSRRCRFVRTSERTSGLFSMRKKINHFGCIQVSNLGAAYLSIYLLSIYVSNLSAKDNFYIIICI